LKLNDFRVNMKQTPNATDGSPRKNGLKIVIFACVDFPEGPATTSRVKLLSRILNGAGHHVSLAIFNANTKSPIPENRSSHGIHASMEYTYLSDKPVRPTRFFNAVMDSLVGTVQSFFYLRKKWRAGAVDAVLFYTPDIYRSLPCLLQSRLYGIPILLELCEIFSSDTRKQGIKPAIQRVGAHLTDRILPGMGSGVLAISTRIVEHLKQGGLGNEKIMHLPILVDCSQFIRPSDSPVQSLLEKRYFLNSGALDSKEGLEVILEAFASISRKHDRLFLVLTGAPEANRKTYILDLAKRLGVDREILFTGFLSVDQLSWAYQNALALICCRADTEFANFGFPTKLAEYLSSGRPVITNEVGDTRLYLRDGETAFFTRSGDMRSISLAMEKVVNSPRLAEEVGLKGREVAQKNFDYSNFIQPLDTFLRSVCGNQIHGRTAKE
jgi:glycosyltransferase involved in cell wall biosynthesis